MINISHRLESHVDSYRVVSLAKLMESSMVAYETYKWFEL